MLPFISFVSFYYGFNSLYRHLTNDPVVKTFENANFLYTGLHALLSSCFSFAFINNTISQNTYLNLITVSAAFALFDITLLIDPRNKVNTKSLLIFHHLMIILGVFLITDYMRVKDIYVKYVAFNFLSEISTPFLNLSIFLNKKNFAQSIIFKINSMIVMLSYFLFRIVIPAQITYELYYNEPFIILMLQLTLSSMNYFWFYKLCKKCLEFFG